MNKSLSFSSAPRAAALLLSLCAAFAATTAHADQWAPNITGAFTWQDNASNANLSSDKIGALQTEWNLLASERYGLGRDDSFHPAIHVGAEWWPRFRGLNRYMGGARFEFRHKFGLGPLATTLFAEVGGDFVAAQETGRRGTSAHLLFGVRKRFDDVWQASLTQEYARQDARAAVFDRRGGETKLEVSRDLNDVARLTVTLGYRDGDVLSYGTPPRPDLVALAPNRLEVDTFGRPMVAYSVDARTVSAKAAVIRALDENSALILGYQYRETERSPLKYVNHLVSLSLVHQF